MIKRVIEIIVSVGFGIFLWDRSVSTSDNIWLLIPLYFIFGLMYYFLKK